MRPLLSIRFVAALAALFGLTLLAWVALPRQGTTSAQLVGAAIGEHQRTIDLLAPVFKTTAGPGFAIDDGVTTQPMVLHLDARRRVEIATGTPGQVTCKKLGEISQCAVAAQLLGDAVVWFALVPSLPRNTLVVPGIEEMLSDNRVLLYNGWILPRASTVERVCDIETDSLSDFLDRFGSKATATYHFDRKQIFRVTCPDATQLPSSTTVPATDVAVTPPPATLDEGTPILDENAPVDDEPPSSTEPPPGSTP